MTLRSLDKQIGKDNPDYSFAFETYQIPDYVLDLIPEQYRANITGAVYELVDGELGEVHLTESNAPYDLRAEYHKPSYWE